MNNIRIIPTCVPRSRDEITSAMNTVRTFATSIHLDVDDGVFAPHHSWPYQSPATFSQSEITTLADAPLPIETHLMVKDSNSIGLALAHAGVKTLVVHIETLPDADAAINMIAQWRAAGIKSVGIAILLDTPLDPLDPLIDSCDFVQVMSVATIGEQGAPFDERTLERVRTLALKYPLLTIAVDGGVSEANIIELTKVGARRFAIGSSIMHADNSADSYAHLQSLAESALQ